MAVHRLLKRDQNFGGEKSGTDSTNLYHGKLILSIMDNDVRFTLIFFFLWFMLT